MRLYKERQVSVPYWWDVVRKYLSVLKSCVGIHMKQLKSKVHGYLLNMMLWHHVHSTSYAKPPNLGPAWQV